MIVAPAVDVRGGRCVQLVGGRPEDQPVSLPDPVGAAARWWQAGFRTLHVVDLDAALGRGDNLDVLTDLCRSWRGETQVGGGIRDADRAALLLDAGADRVIVGSRAVGEPEWLEHMSERWPGRVTVAADHREGVVLTRGWTETTALGVLDLFERLAPLPLAGVLCTDVGREGRMGGVDEETTRRWVAATEHPFWASGGVGGTADLERLQRAGAHGVVIGMALYTGAVEPAYVASRWGGRNRAKERNA